MSMSRGRQGPTRPRVPRSPCCHPQGTNILRQAYPPGDYFSEAGAILPPESRFTAFS